MKYWLVRLTLVTVFLISGNCAWAQEDIELIDNTSSEWGSDVGGVMNPNTPTAPVTSLTLSQSTAILAGGMTLQIVATVNIDAANKKVIWTSSNPTIASINSYGLVRGLAKGTANITATAAGNTSLKKTCVVTVTSDYEGLRLPNVPFEFCYDAVDYDASTQSIPNHSGANLESYSLKLSENIPTFVDNSLLRITNRCEGFIDKWNNKSTESGSYFFRSGTDCLTIVAKVAPRLNTGNACDFISNRGGNHNYMWRIGDKNKSFLHTGNAYEDNRVLTLSSEEAQVLAVRVDGPNNKIFLQNLTTGDTKVVEDVNWGGGDNAFKLFYNDDGEFFLGDFYWVYYSFELLTDAQLRFFDESVLWGDANGDGKISMADVVMIISYILGETPIGFDEVAADLNGDGSVTVTDAYLLLSFAVQ